MASDVHGHAIRDGIRVRFVAGIPSRIRFGTVENLCEAGGTLLARESGGRVFNLTTKDVQVCPVGKREDGTYIFLGDKAGPKPVTKSLKVWIFIESLKTWKHVARSDPRLDWTCRFAPLGSVPFTLRQGKSRREYVFFGTTQEDVIEKMNAVKAVNENEVD